MELLRTMKPEIDRKSESPSGCLDQAQCQSLVANMPLFAAIADQNGRIVYLNRAAGGMTVAEALGRPVCDYVAPAYRPLVENCLSLALRGVSSCYEIEAAGPHGATAWYETHMGPVLVEGRIEAVSLVSQDITLRKQAEEELERTKALLEATIENIPFDFWAMGPDGRYMLQNAALRRNWIDIVGLRPHDLPIAPETLAGWLDNNRRVLAGERIDEEIDLAVKGEPRRLRNVVAPIRIGEEIIGILGFNFDVTDRKIAEDALRQARDELERRVKERTDELTRANAALRCEIDERRRAEAQLQTDIAARRRAEIALQQSHDELHAIYHGMVDGLLVADLATFRFVRANAAICRMLGYTAAELMTMRIFDIHPPEQADLHRLAIAEFVAGKRLRTTDVPVVRKDGSTFFADIDASQIVYDGRPCVMGFFRDISERKLAQEALEKERRTLKHLLQASDHERRLIAYDVHDGLAQQLAGAMLQLQAFGHQREVDAVRAEKAFQTGLTMLEQSHFEARRLISGVRPLILDEAGIAAAIAHLVNDHTYDRGPKIEFRSRVRFRRLTAVLENAMYRIVQEALNNACRHSRTKRVRIRIEQRGTKARLEIRDWGVGFDPAQVREECFGLEGIRERVRVLGGRSRVQSVPGKGTRVVVELPLLRE